MADKMTKMVLPIKNPSTGAIANKEFEFGGSDNAITAEATARQTADNTLQGNINAEASTRASADSNLQSQINQIIAPSGEAPSAAEVQNARIGADGVTYSTLGEAIRANDNNINTLATHTAGAIEFYIKDTIIPANNTAVTFDINLQVSQFDRKLSLTGGSTNGYYFYGLYNNDTLVWGKGVDGSDSTIYDDAIYTDANETKELTIARNIVANKFKIRNRNSSNGAVFSIKSDYIDKSKYASSNYADLEKSLAKEYDSTKTYPLGSYCRYNGTLYRLKIGRLTPEAFTEWRWEKISTVDDTIVPIEDAIFNKNIPWIGAEAINYHTGKIEHNPSNEVRRTDPLVNIEEVIGGDYYFNVAVYKNGIYQGMVDSNGNVSIPSTSVYQIKYAYLGDYDDSYSFMLSQYGNGNTSYTRSPYIEIKLKKFKPLIDIESARGYISVGVGKSFTSLRSALEYAATIATRERPITVQYYGNGIEYDVMNDITSDDLATSSTWIGLTVPAYCKLLGMGSREQNKISLELPSGTDSSTVFRISTINLLENAELENLWFIGKNCRYACHDDMMVANPSWKLKTVKNCRFTSNYTQQHRAYGAGYRSGVHWRFENCIFENINGEAEKFGNAAFSAHNNNGMQESASITFVNCQFSGGHGADFESLNRTSGQDYANAKTIISFYGCKAYSGKWQRPIIAPLPTDTVPNAVLEVCITGYGNNFGPNGVSVYDAAQQRFVHTFDEQLTVWGDELWKQNQT